MTLTELAQPCGPTGALVASVSADRASAVVALRGEVDGLTLPALTSPQEDASPPVIDGSPERDTNAGPPDAVGDEAPKAPEDSVQGMIPARRTCHAKDWR